MPEAVHCLVLAAGRSSRFGHAKMLHAMPNGQTMLQLTVAKYLAVSPHVSVIVDPSHQGIKDSLAGLAVECIDSPLAERGMSQSIIAGVQAYANSLAWLVGLGDMPYVSSATIKRLISYAGSDVIVQPSYQQKAGNPVIFGNGYMPQLLALQGDVGGKKILSEYSSKVVCVETHDSGVLYDIDHPDHIKPS